MHARVIFSVLVGVVFAAAQLAPAAQFMGPTPYLSAADSPFTGLSFAHYFHLETFEDGLLNTLGASASAGNVGLPPPHVTNDSVDADDGLIDGSGFNGTSWYSYGTHEFTFTFDAGALGGLPTHAGIVWTDVGFSDAVFGIGSVVFEAFGPLGESLGSIGPFALGDGAAGGQTAEDRFFGVFNGPGISAIRMSMPGGQGDWEVDHLQYGRVPEPATVVGMAALLLVGSRPIMPRSLPTPGRKR